MQKYLLAIDQGTTNSRAIIFDDQSRLIAQHAIALQQFFPQPAWVEQDPEEMFQNTLRCCEQVLKNANLSANDIIAAGISNQRETTILWDKKTGKPVYPAIVWQDRRTSELCKKFSAKNTLIQHKTGLLLDPYFSATKILWILDNVPFARERAEKGELLFGTVDTYLLWRLTQGKSHKTDATNASRTLLFNIHNQQWDEELLALFQVPKQLLPTVFDNAANFGSIAHEFFGKEIPILGMAGDQQAATIGQACFEPGMVKATYGTGCFMLLNTGDEIIHSKNQLVSTVAYRLENKVTYGLEGSIFSAGEVIKWLRDELKIIRTASETEVLANSIPDTQGVYLIPAFTGLGAPHWLPDARAAISGLARHSGVAHIVRAALESVVYQTVDLLYAVSSDSQFPIKTLRVDGGMTANQWLLQFLADMLNLEIQRPRCIETTALGVAYLAGLQAGVYHSLQDVAKAWHIERSFLPTMTASRREGLYAGWKRAINRLS